MSSSLGAVFLFGKLPAHGDFVARGLSAQARQAWDDWASAALERLREATPDFEASHDAARPWRFVAGPSALGAGWRCGALAPSIDGAGRRFVVAAGAEIEDPHLAAALGVSIAELTEALLYRALGEDLTADAAVDAFAADLALLADQTEVGQALAAQPAGEGAWWSQDSGLGIRAAASPPTDLFAAACAADLRSSAA